MGDVSIISEDDEHVVLFQQTYTGYVIFRALITSLTSQLSYSEAFFGPIAEAYMMGQNCISGIDIHWKPSAPCKEKEILMAHTIIENVANPTLYMFLMATQKKWSPTECQNLLEILDASGKLCSMQTHPIFHPYTWKSVIEQFIAGLRYCSTHSCNAVFV